MFIKRHCKERKDNLQNGKIIYNGYNQQKTRIYKEPIENIF